jgi:hypothetical protein
MLIINDDSRIVTKLETSLTDDAGVIIYDHHMFIVQATGFVLLAEDCHMESGSVTRQMAI